MNPITRQHQTEKLKALAIDMGFLHCGVSKATFLDKEAKELEKWLLEGRHGQMTWMENYFDIRLDPRLLVDDAKSVISLAYNYFPENELPQKDNYKISKYAYRRDYHKVIKKKLKHLISFLKEQIGDFNGRAFVDSAPIMEKVWATKSGITWQGKHTNAINPKTGSFFFLATIVIDVELDYDSPIKDRCRHCRLCQDACPTNALENPYQIDAQKCISYLTIELKDEIPKVFEGKMDNYIFGCDICQDVCPWNRRSKPHQEPDFIPKDILKHMKKEDWHELTEDVFEELFKGSAIKRTKFEGLKRNIEFVRQK